MSMPEISIVICCYNGEKRLSKVLRHIYEETSLEEYVAKIIIVDNHSTDHTKKVIEDNMAKYSNPSIQYCYEEKAGLSNARRKGVSECNTKWIAFLDDDNYVEPQWIKNVAQFINENRNVGVFNGAVIPFVDFKLTEDERQRLQSSLKVLACTHYSIQELQNNPVTPFRNPIGAGMVILTEPLKKLLEKGWLNSAGRTKENLTSGEDGEMAYWVKNCGYQFGFCPQAVLYHEMTKKRIEDAYLKSMWYEIGRGVSVVIKKQRFSKIKNIGYQILLKIRMRNYKKDKNKYKAIYYLAYIEGYKYEWNC